MAGVLNPVTLHLSFQISALQCLCLMLSFIHKFDMIDLTSFRFDFISFSCQW